MKNSRSQGPAPLSGIFLINFPTLSSPSATNPYPFCPSTQFSITLAAYPRRILAAILIEAGGALSGPADSIDTTHVLILCLSANRAFRSQLSSALKGKGSQACRRTKTVGKRQRPPTIRIVRWTEITWFWKIRLQPRQNTLIDGVLAVQRDWVSAMDASGVADQKFLRSNLCAGKGKVRGINILYSRFRPYVSFEKNPRCSP